MQALPSHNKTHTPTADSSAVLVGISKDGMNSSTDLPTISLDAANPNIHANQGSEDTRVPWRRMRRGEEERGGEEIGEERERGGGGQGGIRVRKRRGRRKKRRKG